MIRREKRTYTRNKPSLNQENNNKKQENTVSNNTETPSGQIPPHNIDAEKGLLAGILLKNDQIIDIIDVIKADDFYHPNHSILFEACIELYNNTKAIDFVTVAEYLQSRMQLEQIGGAVYLAELANLSISAIYIVDYAHIIRDKALQRRLIETCSEIIKEAYTAPQEDVKTVLDDAEQRIFLLTERTLQTQHTSAKHILDNVFAMLEKQYNSGSTLTGIATGYPKLDELTSGLQSSELIILAARPSMGKTAFALNLAMRCAIAQGVPCAIFSLEMSARDLMMRMLAIWGKVNLAQMRKGQLTDADWIRLHQATEVLSTAPIMIDDTPRGLTTLDLRARVRRLKSQHNVGLIVVDYLQLMRASRRCDSREQEVAEISRSLKAVAKEVDIPVVALAQLNRGIEQRTDKKPLLSDLRESGSIEQDADVIMFIHREDVYRKNEEHPKKGIADIIIGKQRNGPIGEIELQYLAEYTAFENRELRY